MSGVAMAILTGGPGAIFWMWICAFAAMLLKYAEIALSMSTRRTDPRGGYVGGTPYSMAAVGWRRTGALFAVLCLLNTVVLGGAVQAGAIAEAMSDGFGIPVLPVAVILVLMTMTAVLRGSEKLTALTGRLVPFMCLFYLTVSVMAVLLHADRLPGAFASILSGAFTWTSAGGGLLGFFTSRAVRIGAARGLLSNEGGCGTAPLAHVTSAETEPARQGLFGIFEVFADTVVICTLTALVILTAFPTLPSGLGGMALIRAAFGTVLGGFAGPFVAISLFFFAYATILCEAFYGQTCLRYFTERRPARWGFLLLLGVAIVCGAYVPTESLWLLTDLLLAAMTLLNLALLLRCAGQIVRLTEEAGFLRSSAVKPGHSRRKAQSTH